MWHAILLIFFSQGDLILSEEQVTVKKRNLSNNIAVETVKLLDFDDDLVVDNLVQSVIKTHTEEIIEEILSILSDSELSTNKGKLRGALKRLLNNPLYQKISAQGGQKKQIPLPTGIIKLLKANMPIYEKKKVLEKVFNKVNQVEILAESNSLDGIPREARFTTKEFPYENLIKDGEIIGKQYDFNNCEYQSDGSCCISKVQEKDRLERDDIKECWHKNVTTCYDTYVTEFTSTEEEQCEDVFYKNCIIDFKEIPFDYNIQSCHTPMIKDCSEPATGEVICKDVYESHCNTTYDEDWKPSTSCSREPKEICAPDSCQIIPGEEKCHTKTLVSTSYKPVETCDLQPQTHCTIITKPVPHLKTVPNCYTEEKEVCRRKQGQPKSKGKQVVIKWCKKGDGSFVFPKKEVPADDGFVTVTIKKEDVDSLPEYVGAGSGFPATLNQRTDSKR